MKLILLLVAMLFALALFTTPASKPPPAEPMATPRINSAAVATAPTEPAGQAYDQQADPKAAGVRFKWVDVFLDTGAEPLAAYQFEFTAERGRFSVVGIEGGDAAAFKIPPYYDPAALAHNRVILAAFSTGAQLPAGRVRVARIHVEIPAAGDPQYVARLQAAANGTGKSITATISFTEGAAP